MHPRGTVKAVNVTLRHSIAVAAVALAAPVLSSCSTNFNAPTDQVYTPGVGVNDRSSDVDVLHALVVSGAHGSGTVIAGLVNQNVTEDDALTSISGAGEDASVAVATAGPVTIPAEELVQLANDAEFSIEGEQIVPGRFVELTFTFRNAESVTLNVPVVPRTQEFAEIPVPSIAPVTEAPEEEGGASH